MRRVVREGEKALAHAMERRRVAFIMVEQSVVEGGHGGTLDVEAGGCGTSDKSTIPVTTCNKFPLYCH
jgi:hypothetical protein